MEQQDKLAPHLWAMLELWPDVPRNFLFFGEEEEKIPGETLSKEELYRLIAETQANMETITGCLKNLHSIRKRLELFHPSKEVTP